MIEKHNDTIIPIEYSSWDEIDYLLHYYYNVVFLEDFGGIKKGETYPAISMSFLDTLIECYDANGNTIIKTQKFKIQPI